MKRIVTPILLALFTIISTISVNAGEPAKKTIEALYKEKTELQGQQVQLEGKVVKVNEQIMGKNFVHITDGTGEKGTSDLTVTTQDLPKIGDAVTVTGTVVLDLDLGSGYLYPLIIEKAKISKAAK